jgi:protein involved in polysaccharide export with SLBB domain
MLLGSLAVVSLLAGQNQLLREKTRTQEEQIDQHTPPYKVQVKGTALEHVIDPAHYMVGPGDQFMLSILSTETYVELVTITPTGSIIVPGVGSVSVIGMTAEEVSTRVGSFIGRMFPNYESTCTLYGTASWIP